MNARARGFTLVEMLIVSIMLTLVMGAVYQTLISQQQNTRHLSAVINSHQTNRTSTQYLAGELREIGTRLARDITSATSSRVTFRAMRKVGFVCQNNAGSIDVYSLGGEFVAGDSIVVYADQNTQAMADDSIIRLLVQNTDNSAAAGCPGAGSGPWSQMQYSPQRLHVNYGTALPGVSVGAEVRSFEMLTYGSFTKGTDFVFGRQAPGDTAVVLMGPLVWGGLTLRYFNAAGGEIATPVAAASLPTIARIRVGVAGLGKGAVTKSGTYAVPLVTDVALRGN